MAKKKAAKKELEIVSEEVINGAKIITYEDGSVDVIPAPIHFTAEEWANLHDSDEDEEDSDDDDSDDSDEDEDDEDSEEDDEDSDDEEDEDDDDDDSEDDDDDSEDDEDDSEDDEDEEPMTGEDLAKMDFEELEDVCDDKDLDTDPDDFDEDEIEKFRKEVAKELGLKLPKAAAKGKGKKGKK